MTQHKSEPITIRLFCELAGESSASLDRIEHYLARVGRILFPRSMT
jgi:hypothetical protein